MYWRRRTFDELPALSVRRKDLRRALRTITVAWIFGSIWMISLAGSRLIYFGRMLGFNNFHFGLLAALPFAATFAQLMATILIERSGLRKFQFLDCSLVHRLLWLVVAAIPLFLTIPSPWAAWIALAVIGLSSFLMHLGATAWWTWMGDIIPRQIRGRYMASRARVAAATRIPAVIFLAYLVDRLRIRHAPMTAARQPRLLWGIMAILAIAALLGALDILLFRRIREVLPPRSDKPRPPAVNIVVPPRKKKGLLAGAGYFGRYVLGAIRHLLIEPLTDRVFRRYVAFGATITFAVTVAGPFYMRNCLENLGFGAMGTDGLFLVVGPLIAIASVRSLGRLIDRWGRRPMLIFGTFLTCFSVLPHLIASRHIASPQFLIDGINAVTGAVGSVFGQSGWRWMGPDTPLSAWIIMLASILFGTVGWSAVLLAQNGIILGFSDGHGRSKYVAASAALISIGGVVGGVVGGQAAHMLRYFQEHPICLGPFLWNNWHATFMLSLLGRFGALLWLIGMPDPGSGRVRDMVRYMGSNVYNVIVPRAFYFQRIFGWGRRRNRRRGPNDDGGRR